MVSPRTQTPEPPRALGEGSWRGVIFHVESINGNRGRRGEETEYPYLDDPDFDDLGRAKREHSVSGFLVGPGWEAQWDALLKAIEQKGPGVFVHPWRGPLTCRLRTSSETYSSQDLGTVSFTLELLEVRPDSEKQRVSPVQSQDGAQRVDRTSEASLGRLKDEWTKAFALGDVPASLRNDAAVGLFDDNPAFRGPVLSAGYRLSEEARDTLRDWQSEAFSVAATSLDPDTFADYWIDGVLTFDDLILVSQLWAAFASPDYLKHAETTPGRIAANAHLDLVYGFAPAVLAAEWARLSVLEVYESATAATDERDKVLAALDIELEKQHRSEVYFSLMELRSSVVKDFDRLIRGLAPVIRVHQPQVEPAVVTAWRLYEDADRAEELLDLNDTVHPLFLPASGPIRALEW